MADGNLANLDQARAAARAETYALPIEHLNPAQPALFQADAMWPIFERLRAEDPVHYTAEHEFGPYWSVTKYNDIMAIDTDHQRFSSDYMKGGINIAGGQANMDPLPMFIAMDPPKHDAQRKVVTPAVSPMNLAIMEPLIRERAAGILDSLPIGEEFDWVDLVSKELTGMTLATLFDMPQEDRRQLVYWSDVVTAAPGKGLIDTIEQKMAIFVEYHAYFTELWNKKVNAPPTGDLISMLAHNPVTRNMTPREYFGNVVLLTVGGNDTTRNTISGSILALNQNPDQYAKLIKKGDKVIMWYVSGNRDDEVIENPNAYTIDRERPRQHISFGFGIHRCVGNRLAELQLRVIWEEILRRFPEIVVVGEPKRVYSSFVKGYEHMTVVIPRRI